MCRFISEEEIEKIVLEHASNGEKVMDRSKELLKHAFGQISSKILLQVKLYIENNNNFKTVEKVYNETKNFKKRYLEYLELDYKEDIHNDDERNTLKEVFASVENALLSFPSDKDNPLEYERMLMVSTGLLAIKDGMNSVQEEVVNSFTLPITLNVNFGDLLFNHMYEKYEELYTDLNKEVTSIVEDINNIEKRIELNRYVAILKEQETMLKNFIYINLEIGQEWQTQDNTLELTGKYIYPLRQLYNDIHTIISDVNYVVRKKQDIKALEIKNVDKIIEANILSDKRLKKLIKIIEDDKNNTVDQIIIHINDELTKSSTTEFSKLKKESNRFELLSYIILELFEECLTSIDSLKTSNIQNDLHRRIVDGVTESLGLKYKSLKEKDSYYHLMKKQNHLSYNEDFIKFKNDFEQKCVVYLEEAIAGSYASFNQIQTKFSHLVDKQKTENLNYDLDYFKKDILFEIRTLEDLINQSIDKLKESDEELCLSFVEVVQTMYDKILSHLRRNDIVQITAKEHDTFNGKIHEILVAEEVEGFKKGEIIRMQNSGYIFQNRILVRASSIVAK